MARYTGPKDRISRRFLVPLFGSSRALERRNYPPGQHGLRAGRRKKSDYAIALGEKQKLKFQYGVLEKQFPYQLSLPFQLRAVSIKVLARATADSEVDSGMNSD